MSTPLRRTAVLTAVLACLAAGACALFWQVARPVPARADLFEFTLKDERELGEKFNALVRSKLPLVDDAEIQAYVTDMVNRVAKSMPPQPFPLTIGVIQNNALNAFAAPAGYVFVFTGLILNLNHESEVAAVVAHELAHVTQRHLASRYEKMTTLTIGQLMGMVAGLALGAAAGAPEAGSALILGSQAAAVQTYLGYSREDEREADQVGMNYLVAAGYPPQGMVGAFETIRRMRWLKGQATIPAYLSTHPDVTERLGYLKDRINQMPKTIRDRKEDDGKFLRAQTIIRARYDDPPKAIGYYRGLGAKMTCLDRLGLAVALGRTHDIATARTAFDEALACGGEDPLWLREIGRFEIKSRRYELAEGYLKRSVEKNPNDLTALFEYARLLAQTGHFAQALPYMNRVRMNFPDNAEIQTAYGQMLGQSGDLFRAHLHLAYAAVYENNERQAEFQIKKTKNLAKSEEQKQELAKLEELFKKRTELLKRRIF
jgi:predicted Zn-dependent protease